MRGHRARRPFLRLCPCAGPAAPRASLEQALEDAVSTSVSKPPKQGPSTGLYSFFVVLVTSGCRGLHCWAGFLSLAVSGAPPSLRCEPSLLAERRLQSAGPVVALHTQVQLLRGLWDLPGPGIEPVSPELTRRFLVVQLIKNPPAEAGSIPGWGRSPGEGNGNPLQSSLPGKSHGQRSLVGYSPWDC